MTWPDDHYKAHPYFLMGIKHEQERIITLIDMASCQCEPDCDDLDGITAQELIESIKDTRP